MSRCLLVLSFVLFSGGVPTAVAQTPAQNDSAATAAAKAKTLPLITTRTLKFTTDEGTRLLAIRGSRMHRMRTLEDFGRHGGAAELEYVWLPADGGAPSRITWVGAGATQQGRNAPHFGPDPDRLYIWAGSEGLLSMRYDGTDIKTIVKVTGPKAVPGK